MSDIAEEAQKRNDRQIVDVEEKTAKLVIFTLSGSYYAFYGADVKEILPATKIHPIPGLPDSILGIINVREDLQPVIDIKIPLGCPSGNKSEVHRIVIAEKQGIRSGVQVDSVEDVFDVPLSAIQPLGAMASGAVGSFAVGTTFYQKNKVTILNTGKLIDKITDGNGAVSQVDGDRDIRSIQLLIFNVADSYFGVDMEQIEEIMDPPPGVDMAEIQAFHKTLFLSEAEVVYREPKILFIRDDDENACPITIDRMTNITHISINDIQPLPPLLEGKSEAVWGATLFNGELVLLVDFYKVSNLRSIRTSE